MLWVTVLVCAKTRFTLFLRNTSSQSEFFFTIIPSATKESEINVRSSEKRNSQTKRDEKKKKGEFFPVGEFFPLVDIEKQLFDLKPKNRLKKSKNCFEKSKNRFFKSIPRFYKIEKLLFYIRKFSDGGKYTESVKPPIFFPTVFETKVFKKFVSHKTVTRS